MVLTLFHQVSARTFALWLASILHGDRSLQQKLNITLARRQGNILQALTHGEAVQLALEVGVESILDSVISATRDVLGDLTPLFAHFPVQVNYEGVFLSSPLALVDVGVQVVVPALTALLADATGQALSDEAPVARTKFSDLVNELLVLLLAPGTARKVVQVVKLKPAGVALDLRLGGNGLADTVPRVGAVLLDKTDECLILHRQNKTQSL